jgi:hypothetical protein
MGQKLRFWIKKSFFFLKMDFVAYLCIFQKI